MEREKDNLLFMAKIHGAKIENRTQSNSSSEGPIPSFGDPSKYEGMSQEEKEKITQQMMHTHKAWAKQVRLG